MRFWKTRTLNGAVLLYTVSMLWAVGQDPSFQVTVDLVPVYVSVKDNKGRPIQGLTPADFKLREDGKPQTVLNFKEVDLVEAGQASEPAAAGAERGSRLDPAAPAAASSAESRRFVVIRFDPLQSPRSLQRAQEAAKGLLEELDFRTDHAAVSWRDSISEFTQDRDRIARLIDEVRPTLLALSRSLDQPADPARLTFPSTGGAGIVDDLELALAPNSDLQLLDYVLGQVIALGTRAPFVTAISSLKYLRGKKICFYLGQGLGVPRADDPRRHRWDPEYNARLFSDAGFSVFAINPLGVVAQTLGPLPATGPGRGGRQSMRARSESTFRMPYASGLENIYLRKWAESTGGFAIYNNNNLKKGVRRALEFTQHYYLLTYRSTQELLDAKFRNIEVELVSRKGQLSHRSGYFATNPSPRDLLQRTLNTALLNPEVFRDFPLELSWSRTAPNDLQIEFLFPFEQIPMIAREVINARGKTEQKHLQEVLVAALAVDRAGKPVGFLQENLSIELDEEQLQEFRQQNATLARNLALSGEPALLKGVVIVGQNQQLSALSLELSRDR